MARLTSSVVLLLAAIAVVAVIARCGGDPLSAARLQAHLELAVAEVKAELETDVVPTVTVRRTSRAELSRILEATSQSQARVQGMTQKQYAKEFSC